MFPTKESWLRLSKGRAGKMKLGIYGGSFNPPHLGHLAVADAARQTHGLEQILFVPTGNPPHKTTDLASAPDRFEMVRLAVRGREGLTACDLETRRAGTSYTVDTLVEFRRLCSHDDELFFIVGEDSLKDLPGWKEPERILRLARLVVVNRPGQRAELDLEGFSDVAPEVLRRIERDRVTMTPCPYGSRQIRADLRLGKSIEGQVPQEVAEYIESEGLYRR